MYRKDSIIIEEWLKSSDKALLVTGGYVIKRPETTKSGRLGEKSGYRGEILLCCL